MFEGRDYIYEVYKHKSFSKAALNLYISQPSLSATIKKIETQLGFPLFDRSTNPIGLTERGQKYIQYIEQIMDMESEFENYVNNLDALRIGYLIIGGTNLFSSYILPPLLTKFMEQYPSIEVKLVEDSTKSLEKQLFEGSLDMIIDNYPFSPQIYDRTYFDKEQLLLAVPSHFAINATLQDKQLSTADIINNHHLLTTTPEVSIKDFEDYPFVLLRSGNDTLERSTQVFQNAGIRPKVILELDQQVTAYHTACFGMGISFISDTLLKQVPADPRITYYKLNDSVVKRKLYFYYKHKKYVKRSMQEFFNLNCNN